MPMKEKKILYVLPDSPEKLKKMQNMFDNDREIQDRLKEAPKIWIKKHIKHVNSDSEFNYAPKQHKFYMKNPDLWKTMIGRMIEDFQSAKDRSQYKLTETDYQFYQLIHIPHFEDETLDTPIKDIHSLVTDIIIDALTSKNIKSDDHTS